MSSSDTIERVFHERFGRIGLRLPVEAVNDRRGGHLFHRAWHIGYQWGEENGETYLDVLAQNRFTDDHAERLWACGRTDRIETVSSFYVVPADASDAEREHRGREHAERTARVASDLRRRGLLPPPGENLPSLEINEHLRSGGAGPRSKN
ncbi:MAG: hypothetical protein WKF96_03075 [Solirubrobacteraceae bacterium]